MGDPWGIGSFREGGEGPSSTRCTSASVYWRVYRIKKKLKNHLSGCNFSFQCNKIKKKFLFKQDRVTEIVIASSFNRASFVTFVTVKVTI